MSYIQWVEIEDVISLHDKSINVAGGSHGLRDLTLLESALARPQNLYAYGKKDIYVLAASYAEAIASNHAFVDGNKRSAFTTATFFLLLNNIVVVPRSDDGYTDMMVNLAQGKLAQDDVAKYLKDNSKMIDD